MAADTMYITLKHSPQISVGSIELILAAITDPALQSRGSRGVATLQGNVELAHATPLVTDPIQVDGAIAAPDEH